MINRDPEANFEEFWTTFHERYPFFEARNVEWKNQYDAFRPQVTGETTDEELFEILSRMIEPLNDGHVKLKAKELGDEKKRVFRAETKPRFWLEFNDGEIDKLFETTEMT